MHGGRGTFARRGRGATAVLLACAGSAALGGEVSLKVDCLPDRVVAWEPAATSAGANFGSSWLPGLVLGPPGDSSPSTGSIAVVSLGHTGSITLAFDDTVIEDGPGPDFIVFENAFFIGAPPAGPGTPFFLFAEPGFVEASADGVEWRLFPHSSTALEASRGAAVDQDLFLELTGLAGVTPTFTGNWTLPDDRLIWEAAGPGGVSGAGGDPFDLASVGLSEARFLRITDTDARNGNPGTAEGFDLDAIVALHSRPRLLPGTDTDGDRLPDAVEGALYGTDPALADTDGDGIDDGREAAACRDPLEPGLDAAGDIEPRLWLLKGTCTPFRWTFLGSPARYDLLRGEIDHLASGPTVDLGPLVCLAGNLSTVGWSCDGGTPAAGEAFFYLVGERGRSDLGHASDLSPRPPSRLCP
jgi:hypothetical protein